MTSSRTGELVPQKAKSIFGVQAEKAAGEMSRVEDNPHSRFVDYTCATDWETLINAIEAVLRQWKRHKCQCSVVKKRR
jgi:hypothetical protein